MLIFIYLFPIIFDFFFPLGSLQGDLTLSAVFIYCIIQGLWFLSSLVPFNPVQVQSILVAMLDRRPSTAGKVYKTGPDIWQLWCNQLHSLLLKDLFPCVGVQCPNPAPLSLPCHLSLRTSPRVGRLPILNVFYISVVKQVKMNLFNCTQSHTAHIYTISPLHDQQTYDNPKHPLW